MLKLSISLFVFSTLKQLIIKSTDHPDPFNITNSHTPINSPISESQTSNIKSLSEKSKTDVKDITQKSLIPDSPIFESIAKKLKESDETDKLKKLARKTILGLTTKKLSVKQKLNKMKKDIDRDLMGMFMTIKVPTYKMYHLMYAAHIPQVQDPKISIQTFNPPPISLQKGMMPDPYYYYRMKIPQKPEPDVSKEIHVAVPRSVQDRLKDDVKKAFIEALGEYKHTPFGEGNKSAYKLNIFNSKADRLYDNTLIRGKLSKIYEKMEKIKAGYELFRDGVKKKLDMVNGVVDRYNTVDLNYVIG